MSSNMSGEDQVVHMELDEEFLNISKGEGNKMTEDQRERKRCHRHSPQQIQAMEEFFRDYPHPDKNLRNELSQELGMRPLQVKFWFENKRRQMKAKHQRQEISHRMVEYGKLRAENLRYIEALSNGCCPNCGRMATIGRVDLDGLKLRVQNARLRVEIDRISDIAANYVGKSVTTSTPIPSSLVLRSTPLGSGPFFKGSSSKGKGIGEFGWARK